MRSSEKDAQEAAKAVPISYTTRNFLSRTLREGRIIVEAEGKPWSVGVRRRDRARGNINQRYSEHSKIHEEVIYM